MKLDRERYAHPFILIFNIAYAYRALRMSHQSWLACWLTSCWMNSYLIYACYNFNLSKTTTMMLHASCLLFPSISNDSCVCMTFLARQATKSNIYIITAVTEILLTVNGLNILDGSSGLLC